MLPQMKSRIYQMAEWGCDYVEFDNMDWCTDTQYRKKYGETPGQEFPSEKDCAAYNIAMCDHAHDKGLKCMAKDTGYTESESDYAGGDVMDAITIESYRTDFNWWSDELMQDFFDNNKPVIIVHYDARSNSNKNLCDYILNKYQQRYDSDKIAFICEAKPEKKYLHYDFESTPINPTDAPTKSPTMAPTSSPTYGSVTPSTDPFDVFLYTLNTMKGYQSSDQSITVLETNVLTGMMDNWDTYIELGKYPGSKSNPYNGVFLFQVPIGYDLATFDSLKLIVNYYGPEDDGNHVDKRWRFQIRRYDPSTSKWKWTNLGNSGSMQDWVWSIVEFPLKKVFAVNGGLENIVNGINVAKIRLRTVGNNDDIADIDYLKLSFE
jgi:hypothetical protein